MFSAISSFESSQKLSKHRCGLCSSPAADQIGDIVATKYFVVVAVREVVGWSHHIALRNGSKKSAALMGGTEDIFGSPRVLTVVLNVYGVKFPGKLQTSRERTTMST